MTSVNRSGSAIGSCSPNSALPVASWRMAYTGCGEALHARCRRSEVPVAYVRRRHAEREAAARAREEHEAQIVVLERMVGAREAVLAALPDGIVLFQTDGAVAYSNPAARSLLGRRFDSIEELTPASVREAAGSAARDRAPEETEFETGGRMIQATAVPTGAEGGVVLV